MATGQLNGVLQSLRKTALRRPGDGERTDEQLLTAFLVSADEGAIEALIHRHAAMVWGVCLRVLGNSHDAEDAFQAVFLVFVRKANSIWPRAMAGNWLHGVAYRTAMKTRTVLAKRRAHEKQVAAMPAIEAHDANIESDLRPLIDSELSRLAEHYRLPVVLCDLEGKSQRAAARQLGWPEGTLMTRLSRARQMLAKRLSRHGVAISAGALAATLSQYSAAAQAPAPLVVSTVQAAVYIAAGQTATAVVSAPVAALTEGVLKAMLLTKMKNGLLLALVILFLGSGAALVTQQVLAGRSPGTERKSRPAQDSVPAKKRGNDVQPIVEVSFPAILQGREGGPRQEGRDVRGSVKSVNISGLSITISTEGGREREPAAAMEKTYQLAKDVEVAIGGGRQLRGFFKEGKLADLSEGNIVVLTLGADQKTVESILAEEPIVNGVLKAVDVKKCTLTLAQGHGREGREGREGASVEKTYTVAAKAEIALDDGRGQRNSLREGKLEELAEGSHLTLRLSLDKKQVNGIVAEGSTLAGVIKAIDPAKWSLTLTIPGANRGGDGNDERVLSIAKEAIVVIDDGRGRRLSLKEAKLADLPVGAVVGVKLAADQSFVMFLKAEGPTLSGAFKGADAGKRTITIAIPKGRDDSDEKTFPLAKDVRITLDGNVAKLGDLKVDPNGPLVQLRLTLDQRAVQAVSVRQAGARRER